MMATRRQSASSLTSLVSLLSLLSLQVLTVACEGPPPPCAGQTRLLAVRRGKGGRRFGRSSVGIEHPGLCIAGKKRLVIMRSVQINQAVAE
jgi:hypothetical protein